MKLVLIPAGEFLMGSSKDDPEAYGGEMVNGQKHQVRITRPFYLAVTEVTQRQYRAVTHQSPSDFVGSDELPVEQVSWMDGLAFCNALSVKDGLPPFYRLNGRNVEVPEWTGGGYRLPTEAEWEYACRADSTSQYSFGDNPALLKDHGWFDGNSAGKTHPVGQKPANAFALFDMHGNLYEWCFDGYQTDFYAKSPVDDPVCLPGQSRERVFRGGGWINNAKLARSATRFSTLPDHKSSNLGLRVARGR
jgi:formylglycine-generating enzyme required for sulfatase activity